MSPAFIEFIAEDAELLPTLLPKLRSGGLRIKGAKEFGKGNIHPAE